MVVVVVLVVVWQLSGNNSELPQAGFPESWGSIFIIYTRTRMIEKDPRVLTEYHQRQIQSDTKTQVAIKLPARTGAAAPASECAPRGSNS